PFGDHPWPGQTQITLEFPDKIGIGQPFAVKGELTGVIPEHATLEFIGMTPSPQKFKIQEASDGKRGFLNAALDMTRQRTHFKFRVLANDAVSPRKEGSWHEVQVLPPPRLVALNTRPPQQWQLHSPAYTELESPRDLPAGSGNIDAVAGTRVTLRAATDRPIKEAWIEYRPDASLMREAAWLAPFGAMLPLQ